MDDESKGLAYSLSAKEPYLVVSFLGPATRKCTTTIERCQQDIVASTAKFVVISMKDVSQIERPLIPHFVRMQKQVRDSNKELRICNIRPELVLLLTDLGAVRPAELAYDLPTAIKSFLTSGRDGRS